MCAFEERPKYNCSTPSSHHGCQSRLSERFTYPRYHPPAICAHTALSMRAHPLLAHFTFALVVRDPDQRQDPTRAATIMGAGRLQSSYYHSTVTVILVLPMDSHCTQSYGISSPPPYSIGAGSTTQQSVLSTIGQNSETLDGDRHAVAEVICTIHTYDLKEYAFISIKSHASNTQDVPLVYLGEQTTGSVVFPEYRLHELEWLSLNRIYSYGCLYLTPRTHHTRQSSSSCLSKLIVLISQTKNFVGALPLDHLPPHARPPARSRPQDKPIPPLGAPPWGVMTAI
ncbi:hypothetical protein EDB89DRAFT_273409 [Lactarius sanguifluus]|nr:hypothetical protein EDB89DRAFT_273409 [Lactarius sanguifluus]